MLSPPFVPPGGAGLDVTDAEAVAWFKGYLARAEALGLDGSMTDFGEWVPFDAQFADGRTGAEVHNQYPLLWQQANREFWEEARPDGDYLFYVRSGFTGTQRFAPAVWGGDQNTMADGTRVELQSAAPGRPRSATTNGSEVAVADGDRAVTLETGAVDDVTIELELDTGRAVLTITGAPLARSYTVRVIG